jgi:hypothetical protein
MGSNRPLPPYRRKPTSPALVLLLPLGPSVLQPPLGSAVGTPPSRKGPACRSPKLRKALTPVRVTMLQATPHAIHFNRVLNLDEEQAVGRGRYVIDFKADQNFGEPQGALLSSFRKSRKAALIYLDRDCPRSDGQRGRARLHGN